MLLGLFVRCHCMPVLVLILALLFSAPSAAKVYRWVDEDGRVHYGDRIPPKYAQQERQELNQRGVVIDEQNAPPTAEELEVLRAQKAEEEKKQREAEEQARYDQFLLGTYATQDQILLRRDEQLGILDSRIASAEKSVNQSRDTLASLNKRAEGKDPVPDKLAGQIRQWSKAVNDGAKALEKMQAERARVSGEFERDLKRYRELTGQP